MDEDGSVVTVNSRKEEEEDTSHYAGSSFSDDEDSETSFDTAYDKHVEDKMVLASHKDKDKSTDIVVHTTIKLDVEQPPLPVTVIPTPHLDTGRYKTNIQNHFKFKTLHQIQEENKHHLRMRFVKHIRISF